MTTSTGPTTPAGKAIAAQNSLKHGLRARAIVLPDESQDDWEAFEQAYLDDLAPVGIAEQTLALRAAELLWRMRRVAVAERNAVFDQMERPDYYTTPRNNLSSFSNYRPPIEPPDMLPDGLPAPAALRPIMRYEAHLSRQFFQVTRELQAMQDRRNGRTATITRVEIHGYPGKSEPHAHPTKLVAEGGDPATAGLPNELPTTVGAGSPAKRGQPAAPSSSRDSSPENATIPTTVGAQPVADSPGRAAPSPSQDSSLENATNANVGAGSPAKRGQPAAPSPVDDASPHPGTTPTTPKLPNELHDITRKSLPHLSPGTADLLRLLLDRAEADDEDDEDEPRPIPDWATPEAEAEDERLLDEMSPVPRYKGPF